MQPRSPRQRRNLVDGVKDYVLIWFKLRLSYSTKNRSVCANGALNHRLNEIVNEARYTGRNEGTPKEDAARKAKAKAKACSLKYRRRQPLCRRHRSF